ncbi:gamma-aminobutyric acid receptor subunit pi-like isoform X2 [Tachypleus tridentatus]|uniref:gamma-aminobutyric acid receptor subunit pi-like isoform X2 n=1 Tax=Tachypleus tridentatus TaxID=6853 RepID=UPI003FD47051
MGLLNVLVVSILTCLKIYWSCGDEIEIRCDNSNTSKNIFPDTYLSCEPPPVLDKPTKVYVSLQILEIDGISEHQMEFRMHAYLVIAWKDRRLDLEKLISGDEQFRTFPCGAEKFLWKPDIVFHNSKHVLFFSETVPNSRTKVLRDGSIYYYARYLVQVGCLMELHRYPLDTQHCNFQMSLRNYSTLVAEFTFVRRMMSSVVNTYIPSTLVVILSWFTFWLDVQAVPGRVTLGVTSFLTLATQVVQTRSQLPPVDYLKALDIWLLACFIMVSFSLLEYAVAYYVFYDYSDNKINKVHSVLHSYVRETEQSVKRDCDSRCSNSSLTKASKTPKIDRISRIGFPVIFSLFFISYWIHFMNE